LSFWALAKLGGKKTNYGIFHVTINQIPTIIGLGTQRFVFGAVEAAQVMGNQKYCKRALVIT
jgi:hypothetical protein